MSLYKYAETLFLLKIIYFSIRHQSHPQFLGSDNKNQVQDMYDRDTNNNENYLLTDNNNYFYPKSTSLLTKDDWMWKEKRPLGSHTKISPLNAEAPSNILFILFTPETFHPPIG